MGHGPWSFTASQGLWFSDFFVVQFLNLWYVYTHPVHLSIVKSCQLLCCCQTLCKFQALLFCSLFIFVFPHLSILMVCPLDDHLVDDLVCKVISFFLLLQPAWKTGGGFWFCSPCLHFVSKYFWRMNCYCCDASSNTQTFQVQSCVHVSFFVFPRFSELLLNPVGELVTLNCLTCDWICYSVCENAINGRLIMNNE